MRAGADHTVNSPAVRRTEGRPVKSRRPLPRRMVTQRVALRGVR